MVGDYLVLAVLFCERCAKCVNAMRLQQFGGECVRQTDGGEIRMTKCSKLFFSSSRMRAAAGTLQVRASIAMGAPDRAR